MLVCGVWKEAGVPRENPRSVSLVLAEHQTCRRGGKHAPSTKKSTSLDSNPGPCSCEENGVSSCSSFLLKLIIFHSPRFSLIHFKVICRSEQVLTPSGRFFKKAAFSAIPCECIFSVIIHTVNQEAQRLRKLQSQYR